MLVSRVFPQDSQLGQSSAYIRTSGAVLIGQMVAERAVGEAQAEVLDHLR